MLGGLLFVNSTKRTSHTGTQPTHQSEHVLASGSAIQLVILMQSQ